MQCHFLWIVEKWPNDFLAKVSRFLDLSLLEDAADFRRGRVLSEISESFLPNLLFSLLDGSKVID